MVSSRAVGPLKSLESSNPRGLVVLAGQDAIVVSGALGSLESLESSNPRGVVVFAGQDAGVVSKGAVGRLES